MKEIMRLAELICSRQGAWRDVEQIAIFTKENIFCLQLKPRNQ